MRVPALIVILLLTGCATAGREGRLAFIDVSGAEGCTVRAQNRPFALPAGAALLEAHLAKLAAAHAGAIVATAQPLPPFRCRTAFMLSLRKAGFRRIGFLDDFDGAAPAE